MLLRAYEKNQRIQTKALGIAAGLLHSL